MLSPKRLIKAASITRRRLRILSSSSTTEKGHFVVYTVDHARFVIPLSYLEHGLLQELLKLSEEEFGTSSKGPITLLCDAVAMEYMMLLFKRGVTQDVEFKSMHNSIVAASTCSNFASTHHDDKHVNMDMVCDCC